MHYIAEFKKTRQTEPNFAKGWGRAMASFGELVTAHTLETAKRIITTALGDTYVRRINPWELRDDANKYIGKQPPRGKQPVSTQHGVADEAVAKDWGKAKAAELLGDAAQ